MKAADVAWTTFKSWKHVTGSARRQIFLRAADLVKERAGELVRILVEETSCVRDAAKYQVWFVEQMLRDLAGRVTIIEGRTPQAQTPGVFALTIKQPTGPVLIISPWNTALLLAARYC